MSSQISSRPTKTPKDQDSQAPDRRKKQDEMPPQNKMKRLESLTANRKPSWTWMAAAAGSAILSLILTFLLFVSFSVVGFLLIDGVAYIISMFVTSRVLEYRLISRVVFLLYLVCTALFLSLDTYVSVC